MPAFKLSLLTLAGGRLEKAVMATVMLIKVMTVMVIRATAMGTLTIITTTVTVRDMATVGGGMATGGVMA